MEVFESQTAHELVDHEEALRALGGDYLFHYELDGKELDAATLDEFLIREGRTRSAIDFAGRAFHWLRVPEKQSSFFTCRADNESEVLATVGVAVGEAPGTWMWRIQSPRLLKANVPSAGMTNVGREQAAANAERAIEQAELKLKEPQM
ncbi:hypothetical protein EFR00_30315 [Rhizobium sophoriradicis]|uniref:hypothetical protein n=1 Tax=Rhizobium sophoriradicis TaxID=1535245 RepID=UPI0009D16962|nr:hypothetical protein [Rhizobium sophoriradicis]RSB82445.1 hypothetical protein EFR00_30315 [Rhizobium sophoriradicis]